MAYTKILQRLFHCHLDLIVTAPVDRPHLLWTSHLCFFYRRVTLSRGHCWLWLMKVTNITCLYGDGKDNRIHSSWLKLPYVSLYKYITNLANMRSCLNIGLLLGQRRRRWANNQPTLSLRLMFSGKPPYELHISIRFKWRNRGFREYID